MTTPKRDLSSDPHDPVTPHSRRLHPLPQPEGHFTTPSKQVTCSMKSQVHVYAYRSCEGTHVLEWTTSEQVHSDRSSYVKWFGRRDTEPVVRTK